MAEYHVGKIHVSPGNVHIESPTPPAELPEKPSAFLSAIAATQMPRAAIIGAGLVVVATGLLMYALSGPGTPATFFLQGGGLLPPGFGLVAIGAAWPQVQRWAREEILRREAAVVAPVAAKLRPHLGLPTPECTLSALVRRAGVSTEEAVRALRWMRDTGEVAEELELGSGVFYYGFAVGQGLDARHDTITRGRDA